ncbi:MAG: DUF1810 domain-containing protein [Candidatus Limnocylindrales bacterium]
MTDEADLERFVTAQAPVYGHVLDELRAGHKRSHWMWFVFPQLRGLGHSDMAWRYGIEDLAEARAFLAHPVLGVRLHECLALVVAAPGAIEAILGPVDAVKLRSCATLFDVAADGDPSSRAVLDRWWGGAPDEQTLELLGRGPDA